MIRFQIFFAILFLSHALTGYFAYNYAKGKQAIVENKTLVKSIENDNNDKKQIEKHTKQIENTRIIYRDRIVKMDNIPVNDASIHSDCHLRDYSTSLRNETYRAFPKVYFQSADSLPSSNN